MPQDAPASLTPEVQQALQQAVVDANDAANLAKKEKKDKKKKKRQRENDDVNQPPAVNGDGDAVEGDQGRKRKKKKKRHHSEQALEKQDGHVEPLVVEETAQPEPTATPAPQPSAIPEEPTEQERKKKKKKKDKGKERVAEEPPLDQPAAIPAVDDASTADFLSAVVAAASATSGAPQPSDYHNVHTFPPFHQGHFPYVPPPIGFPYSPPHPVYGHAPPPQPIYPDIPGLSLADLTSASSEELLRTLQDIDISKIATVLKSLGDAAAANNAHLNIPPSYLPVAPPGPPPVRQRPVKSDIILGRPPKPSKGPSKRPPLPPSLSTKPPEPGDEGNPDHAHMLANVWMNAAKLADMVKKEGLVYKKGKFSAIEEAQLSAAIENYRASRGLSREELSELIFAKEKGRDTFWPEITAAVHLRPIIAVYHHVRRVYHPHTRQGKWTATEDEALRAAVAEFGQQWTKISVRIGRMDSDCRDRYRNHLQDREKRQTGHWTKEEEERLTQIVTEMTVQQGKDIDNDIFWGVVSTKMGGTRGRQQCRIKWTDSLSTQYKNQGERPRWGQMDAYLLVHKVDSLNVRDDTEIDWKLLPDEHWNSWSAHSLQRRWLTMKRSIKGYEEMSHAEIMDILRTKKAQSPPPPTRKRSKKYTSAEAVASDSSTDDETNAAGSSTGPGTAAGAQGSDSD
ncbi:hypothetical protein BXZ70DRAFT_344152 [Cristinia sonorae]|uniref:Uncharacterized protein n=1 Tax=Cristinia sonorae TaxID=1940300 RepID=A0A8K0XN72_9AGAR|nr:hypothetical protein BXZ70DRAFT_344152 [Cristinia sonorae]